VIIKMRPYSGPADLRQMVGLGQTWPAELIAVADLPYRLSSWALDDSGNVGLWVDGAGQLLAWAVLNTPFWTLDYAYPPLARDYGIHPQILTWASRRAAAIVGQPAGRPSWFARARDDQPDRLGDLARAGFVRQDTAGADAYSQVALVRPAGAPLAAPAGPDGFTIRPLAGESEVAAYTALHQAAFGSPNMTAAWRARTLQQPEYRPDLDLVVVAPDGRLAAFCLCWLAPRRPAGHPVGQVEPLGVHPDFRRQGLGRAVLLEGLRRLQAHGAATLTVETDDYRDAAFGLYQAAGFEVAHRIVMWRKDFSAGPAET